MRSGGAHKKRSQNERLPTMSTSMDAGAFRVFLLILASTVELWADGVAMPAVTTNATTTVTNAVSITTNSPSVTTNTVLVPEVVGSTNAPPVASGTNSVAEVKQEIPANLGAFSVIPRKDPFRLTKPEPEEAEPEIVAPRTVGVPQLAGISTLQVLGVRSWEPFVSLACVAASLDASLRPWMRSSMRPGGPGCVP